MVLDCVRGDIPHDVLCVARFVARTSSRRSSLGRLTIAAAASAAVALSAATSVVIVDAANTSHRDTLDVPRTDISNSLGVVCCAVSHQKCHCVPIVA